MRLAGGHADRADVLGPLCQTAMDMHRAAFLGEPRHFHHACALAIQLRRLCQQRADGHNTGAADAGDDDVMGAVNRWQFGHRQVGNGKLGGRVFADLCAFERQE